MAIFPRVQSPCPYKGNLSDIMDGDICNLCEKPVFDLTAMSDRERVAFMAGCSSEVCVSYRFPLRPALAAAALAAALPVPAFAQDAAQVGAPEFAEDDMTIIVGGIRHPGKVAFVDDRTASADQAYDTSAAPERDAPKSELPVIYEDEPAPLRRDEPAR